MSLPRMPPFRSPSVKAREACHFSSRILSCAVIESICIVLSTAAIDGSLFFRTVRGEVFQSIEQPIECATETRRGVASLQQGRSIAVQQDAIPTGTGCLRPLVHSAIGAERCKGELSFCAPPFAYARLSNRNIVMISLTTPIASLD